ncbi:MAG: hypothetical protein GY810_27885 [Aureispira sp.]|nr:hypothetical protein [Aureispira sp.]
MIKKILGLSVFWSIAVVYIAQGQTKKKPVKPICIDMFVASSQKAFKSRKVERYSMWERIENNCAFNTAEIPTELTSAFEGVSKRSQSHMYSLVKGNVKISNQIIAPTERQFFQSEFLSSGSRSKTFGCLTGMSYKEESFILSNVNYFKIIIENIEYIQDELQYKYHVGPRSYSCKIIKKPSDIDSVMNNPLEIGWLLSIAGGHTLGNFLFIEQAQYRTNEYRNTVMGNIDILKGAKPLRLKTKEYLKVPIFSISFGNFFQDGICGKVAQFSLSEEDAFKRQDNIGEDFSDLGKAVVERLLTRKGGRRILVDVGGISLKAREWYYKHIRDRRFEKDTIPILATNVGISGLSKKDKNYSNEDAKLKNSNAMLNHRHANLCKEDVLEVLRSNGLIGISLERDKLMGKSFQTRYNATVAGSANRRRVAVDAIVSNVCKIIKNCYSIEAWDIISIGSQFDTHARHLEMYNQSSDMYQLYKDLLLYFRNPRDIEGTFDAKDIKDLMYDYTPQEIVDKIMYKNALSFVKKHLPKIK